MSLPHYDEARETVSPPRNSVFGDELSIVEEARRRRSSSAQSSGGEQLASARTVVPESEGKSNSAGVRRASGPATAARQIQTPADMRVAADLSGWLSDVQKGLPSLPTPSASEVFNNARSHQTPVHKRVPDSHGGGVVLVSPSEEEGDTRRAPRILAAIDNIEDGCVRLLDVADDRTRWQALAEASERNFVEETRRRHAAEEEVLVLRQRLNTESERYVAAEQRLQSVKQELASATRATAELESKLAERETQLEELKYTIEKERTGARDLVAVLGHALLDARKEMQTRLVRLENEGSTDSMEPPIETSSPFNWRDRVLPKTAEILMAALEGVFSAYDDLLARYRDVRDNRCKSLERDLVACREEARSAQEKVGMLVANASKQAQDAIRVSAELAAEHDRLQRVCAVNDEFGREMWQHMLHFFLKVFSCFEKEVSPKWIEIVNSAVVAAAPRATPLSLNEIHTDATLSRAFTLHTWQLLWGVLIEKTESLSTELESKRSDTVALEGARATLVRERNEFESRLRDIRREHRAQMRRQECAHEAAVHELRMRLAEREGDVSRAAADASATALEVSRRCTAEIMDLLHRGRLMVAQDARVGLNDSKTLPSSSSSLLMSTPHIDANSSALEAALIETLQTRAQLSRLSSESERRDSSVKALHDGLLCFIRYALYLITRWRTAIVQRNIALAEACSVGRALRRVSDCALAHVSAQVGGTALPRLRRFSSMRIAVLAVIAARRLRRSSLSRSSHSPSLTINVAMPQSVTNPPAPCRGSTWPSPHLGRSFGPTTLGPLNIVPPCLPDVRFGRDAGVVVDVLASIARFRTCQEYVWHVLRHCGGPGDAACGMDSIPRFAWSGRGGGGAQSHGDAAVLVGAVEGASVTGNRAPPRFAAPLPSPEGAADVICALLSASLSQPVINGGETRPRRGGGGDAVRPGTSRAVADGSPRQGGGGGEVQDALSAMGAEELAGYICGALVRGCSAQKDVSGGTRTTAAGVRRTPAPVARNGRAELELELSDIDKNIMSLLGGHMFKDTY